MDWLKKKKIVLDYVHFTWITLVCWIRILSGNLPCFKSSNDVLLLENNNKDYVDWLQLPEDVLSEIPFKFIDIIDNIRFGAVCHTWRSVYIDNNRFHHLPRQPPLLMLATQLNLDDQTRSFYSLVEKKVFNFQVPVPHNLFISGSSYGWLVTVSETHQVSLFNPFASVNNEIKLPPLTTFEIVGNDDAVFTWGFRSFLFKVVLSANPTSNPNYVAMAIYAASCSLAFYRPGDKAWTLLPSEFCAEDIIYFGDQFYIISAQGEVYTCDLNDPQPSLSSVAPPLGLVPYKRYLVESSGELLQILRYMDYNEDEDAEGYYFNDGFYVFKLNPINLKWIKIDSLQGRVLFLGNNSSYAISAFDFPRCKPNTIYFTDDYYEGYFEKEKFGPHDIGVFNIEDRTLEQHYPITSNTVFPAPIWVEPLLY
ncbi:hypothetical protein AQUCO_01600366v1 [Aquilegia coerulea]|uniref:Uncharacterized protein n=1 Tax=Aquilegia coerulea TaxID=218851 RepID=A0A2G5DRA2_AQUCA|nr:hypothetical protein AQUCO_01600366v1 [Aquilegia coerulea]